MGAIAIAQADPALEFGFFAVPGPTVREDGLPTRIAVRNDLGYAVPTNAPNQEGALAFLEFISRKDIYSRYINKTGFLPTQLDTEIENPFFQELSESLVQPAQWPEIEFTALSGIGEYGANYGFSFFYLDILGGPFTCPFP